MNVSRTELRRQLGIARSNGWAEICGASERANGLPSSLLLAIASRETNMADVVGDGGHGRGLFQIDDRSWKEWLAAHGASGRGKTPPVEDAARLAGAFLRENLTFGRRNGVTATDLLKFACSAYNAGPGGAIAGYREGDSDLHTTGDDYGGDVLERLAVIGTGRGQVPLPADGILRVGSRGASVVELKERLQEWFDLNAPGEWKTFRIETGAFFGPRLERIVRVFQERRGLLVDGEVGPQTLAALGVRSGPPVEPAVALPADLTLDRVHRKGTGGLYVRLIQGWLSLRGFALAVDGEFGAATARQVRAFQEANGLPASGGVDQTTYDRLTAPMHTALKQRAAATSVGAMVTAYAEQHLAQRPQEVRRIANDGPWVRLYMDGNEGEAWPWCAGFATFVLKQACATMGTPMPLARTYAVDEMARTAKATGAFLPTPSRAGRRRITPGSMFLRRAVSGDLEYAHTGIVLEADADTFTSIEGNTNDGGSFEGIDVRRRVRGYERMDFALIS